MKCIDLIVGMIDKPYIRVEKGGEDEQTKKSSNP